MESKKLAIYILVPLGIVILVAAVFFGIKQRPPAPVRMVFWGLEKEEVYSQAIKTFKEKNSYITIEYVQKTPATYEKELLNAMAAAKGPDIFSLGHNWLPRYKDKISPAPAALLTLKDYYTSFVDVASFDFIADGSIWAVPLSVDTLALYWNKSLFNSAGIPEPPKTWDDFLSAVSALTLRDEQGNILRPGAALGASSNIPPAADILAMLMIQSGAEMINESKTQATFNAIASLNGSEYKPGETALKFYTDFANPQRPVYTWHSRLTEPLALFSQGKLAMFIDYSSALEEIKALAPYLNFGAAFLPQLKDAETKVNYADYFGQTVWKKSKNTSYGWKFIVWLAQPDNLKTYLETAKKPTSRRDLVAWQKNDPSLGVFAEQGLSARSWYQADNEAIKKIFTAMIDSVNFGQTTAEKAVDLAVSQINLLMRQ